MAVVIENVVEELKSLPPERLEEVASYIHSVNEQSRRERRSKALKETFGVISESEAHEWEASVNDCRKIDHENW